MRIEALYVSLQFECMCYVEADVMSWGINHVTCGAHDLHDIWDVIRDMFGLPRKVAEEAEVRFMKSLGDERRLPTVKPRPRPKPDSDGDLTMAEMLAKGRRP